MAFLTSSGPALCMSQFFYSLKGLKLGKTLPSVASTNLPLMRSCVHLIFGLEANLNPATLLSMSTKNLFLSSINFYQRK